MGLVRRISVIPGCAELDRLLSGVYSIKSVFALIAYLLGTGALLWGTLLTQLPWYPQSVLQAASILGSVFALGLGALGAAWLLMRSGRAEVLSDDPLRWRWTEYALVIQASAFALLLILLAVSTLN